MIQDAGAARNGRRKLSARLAEKSVSSTIAIGVVFSGLPASLGSCHTAVIDGIVFEGHVPIADMQRVLRMRPAGVRGLAVAGMPLGSAGMEVPGVQAQHYSVIFFGPSGTRVYSKH